MNRFFVEPHSVGATEIQITDKDDIKHISRVLRLGPGDKVEISDSIEFEYLAEISTVNPDNIQLTILNKQNFASEPRTLVTLYQGVPKQSKMETVIQKTVELGINNIVPVFTARTVVVGKDGFDKKTDRWNKISYEAAKQCKRGFVPEVKTAMSFSQMLNDFAQYDLVLFPYENEKSVTIKSALLDFARGGINNRNVALIIGPEGGFSDEEAQTIVAGGGVSVTLGKTVLRTETAGLAALAMVMYELELQ